MTEEVKRFKLREEKHVAAEITLMAWSPTMDLIALANNNGEVVVNRLSWQRVWSIPTYDERQKDIKVSALTWRPDGKILAIGYTNGVFRLCEVEKGENIREETGLQECITSLVWMEQMKEMADGAQTYPEDNSSMYLPQAQQLNSLYSDSPSPKGQYPGQEAQEVFRNLASKKELGLLMVGTASSQVHLFAYGVFHLCALDLSTDDVTESHMVESALISQDLEHLSVVVRSIGPGEMASVHIQTFETKLLVQRHEEIRLLCSKYTMIISTDMEIDLILAQMCEAWEEILREMDSKLLKFAKSSKQERKEGWVSNDFLELLLFGTTSLETQSFLLHDLTDKGLKKLGYSIENSYSNIQKLVVRQLQRATQTLAAHMSDLHGMSQWFEKFGVLGLNPDTVHKAVLTAAEFAVSAHELQQVIDTSIKNFKAFFRWLYIAILRLSNEVPPPEINKMTQHDIKFVADFLKDNFFSLLGEGYPDGFDSFFEEESDSSESTGSFRLEKVGQYLKDVDLSQPPEYQKNPWNRFLDASTTLKDSKVLQTREMQGKSMRQRKIMMVDSYLATEKPIAKTIGNSMQNVSSFQLFTYQNRLYSLYRDFPRQPKVVQFLKDTNHIYTVYVEQETPGECLYLISHTRSDNQELKVVQIKVGRIGDPSSDDTSSDRAPCERHEILDFAVFTPQTITLMLREIRDGEGGDGATSAQPGSTAAAAGTGATPPAGECTTLLVQLPISCVPASAFRKEKPASYRLFCHMESFDVGPLLSRASVSYQPGVLGHSLAVGGVRTTASMLLSSQRRIRLFLLEDGEEEDDDDDEGATRDESTRQEDESIADNSQAEGPMEDSSME